MFKKLIESWKQDWLLKNAAKIAKEYESRQRDLISKLDSEMKLNLQKLELERDVLYAKVRAEIQKEKLLEEEVTFRAKTLEERKIDLIKADNDLKQQIKLIEAKASPSAVWTEAFSQGVSKCWDLLLPSMTENIEKLKSKIREDAIHEAIGRLNATNKK